MHQHAIRSLIALVLTTGLLSGVSAQLRLVADIAPGPRSSAPSSLTMLNGRALFFAMGHELWSTDGTAAGTTRIGSHPPGLRSGGLDIVVVRGRALFAHSSSRGPEFWSTDGTPAGTRALDLLPNQLGAYPDNFTTFDGDLVFTGFGPNSSSRPSLWRTDGTSRGTTLVSIDVVGFPAVQIGDKLWFHTVRNRTTQLAAYDGQRTKIVGPTSGYSVPAALGDEVVFARSTSNATELWITDGTTAGTRLLSRIASRAPISLLRSTGSRVFFRASDPIHGTELWTSDGTPAGTKLVIDLIPGGGFGRSGMSDQLGIAGNRAVFVGTRGRRQLHLFSSDGTAAGTVQLATLKGRAVDLTNVGPGQVWLRELRGDAMSQRLWRTDGTVARTVLAGDAWRPPTPIGVPSSAAMPGGRLLLSGEIGNFGVELLALAGVATTVTVANGCGNNRNPRLRMTDPVLGRALECFGEGAEPGSVAVLLFGRPVPTNGACTLNINASGPGHSTSAPGWASRLAHQPADSRQPGVNRRALGRANGVFEPRPDHRLQRDGAPRGWSLR